MHTTFYLKARLKSHRAGSCSDGFNTKHRCLHKYSIKLNISVIKISDQTLSKHDQGIFGTGFWQLTMFGVDKASWT